METLRKVVQVLALSFLLNVLVGLPTGPNQTLAQDSRRTFTVTVVCTGHVDCERGLKAYNEAARYIESKVEVKFQFSTLLKSKEAPQGTLLERWQKWGEIAVKLGAPKSDLAVILTETFPDSVNTFDFDEEGIAGMATGIGVLGRKPCAVFIKVMGGEKFLTRLITHEIGHVLGAKHTEFGIMHPSTRSIQYSDEFSLDTLREINLHLQTLKLLDLLNPKKTKAPKIEEPKKAVEPKKEVEKTKDSAPIAI